MRGLKTLDRIKRHPGVETVYHDSDGWWMELKPGWKNTYDEPNGELHGAHESTLTALALRVSGIFTCECQACKDLIARRQVTAKPIVNLVKPIVKLVKSSICQRCGALRADHMDYGRGRLVCPTTTPGTFQ